MGLAVVRDLRETRVPAGPEELAAFETDVLAGWICDGAAMVAFYTGPPGGVFGFTLLALAMLIIPFSGVARPSGARRRARDSKP